MNYLATILCKYFLPNVVAHLCDEVVPRSGMRGERVNCFVFYIDNDGKPYLFVKRIEGDNLHVLEWDGNHYSSPKSIPLETLDNPDIFIMHYYGLSEVRYRGIYDLAINRLTRWPYLKIHFGRILSRLDQNWYNRRKLVTKQRVDLLRFLLSRYLEGEPSINSLHLMTNLYTVKWILHPEGETQRRKVDLYLDGLASTGELRRNNDGTYVLTGHALRAIEEYEEQERRHAENVGVQRRMFWLAFAILLLTLVQAGLVKLRPFIDLSRP